MQVRISLQTDNHASTPPLSFFTGRMPFLPPNQQRQSTEGINLPMKRIYSNSNDVTVTNISESFTHRMAAKPSWHRKMERNYVTVTVCNK